MSIILPLAATLARLGPAEVFIGDPMTAGLMTSLGTLEGERRAEIEFADSALTLPEQYGDIPVDMRRQVSKAEIHCSVILNASGAAIWPKINPMGTSGGGSAYFKAAPTTGVLLIPHSELGGALAYTGGQWVRTAGNGYAGGSGASFAPVHSIWLWKASVRHGPVPFAFADGGKSKVDVVFVGQVDTTKPDGYMVYAIGDPRANGINVTL